MSSETCQYWIDDKRCGHTLGPWMPTKSEVDGTVDVMTRVCEKCGGQQTQFRTTDAETNEAIEELFKVVK